MAMTEPDEGVVPRAGAGVSIGLPVFNGMPDLPTALESLLAQDAPQLEIIISDNASEDGTTAYCEAVAARDPRIRYYRNEVNQGAVSNFQRVVDLSTAPYFAWAAHDDWYSPTFISSCLEVLLARPEAGFCVPAHRRVDKTGALISIRQEPLGLASRDLETRLRAHLWRRGWLTLYGLWRKEVLTRIGPMESAWGSDVIFLWRALLLAPAEVLPQPLADYRVVREKTADTVMLAATGVPSHIHFPNSSMVRDLRRVSADLDLSADDKRIAMHVLRRWVLTHHYRELIATDFLVESRRFRARGANLRAALLLLPVAVLGPRMGLNRIRAIRGEGHKRR
jgi:glycosyltransferase involved in cell wall biosynthesis